MATVHASCGIVKEGTMIFSWTQFLNGVLFETQAENCLADHDFF